MLSPQQSSSVGTPAGRFLCATFEVPRLFCLDYRWADSSPSATAVADSCRSIVSFFGLGHEMSAPAGCAGCLTHARSSILVQSIDKSLRAPD